MADILKPCPFCGAEPLKSFLFDGDYFKCIIKCSACFVSISSVNKFDKRSKNNPAYIFISTEREAESQWNRRYGQDDTQDA